MTAIEYSTGDSAPSSCSSYSVYSAILTYRTLLYDKQAKTDDPKLDEQAYLPDFPARPVRPILCT